MDKSIKVCFHGGDGFINEKAFDYKNHFSIEVENEMVYIGTDGNMQIAISKDYFLSLERNQTKTP